MEKELTSSNPPSSSILLLALTILISCFSSTILGESIIGINWGRQTNHRLIPSMVVDLLLQNNIRHLKLYSASDNVLKAFAGSGIALTVTFPNEATGQIYSKDQAKKMLDSKVKLYQDKNITIRYIHVGNQPFTPRDNVKYENSLDALKFVQEVLAENPNKYNVTATTPHFTDVLNRNIRMPSEADFRPDLKGKLEELVHILEDNNAPFVVDMFPISDVSRNGWDAEFAYIGNKSNFTIVDENGLVYRNVFEFVYDSFLQAIAKAGGPNVNLVVGQVGWPTDGFPGATAANAERFFKEFLPYVKSNQGTPLRPGQPIDVYIHSLSDENLNSMAIGSFQRHWGVYRSNGEPKYNIDFTGQGREIYPTIAKGIIPMPERWCVYNGDKSNLTKVREGVRKACQVADCTTLSPGGSCSHLDFNQNISYAFNMYFQASGQNETECEFGGLAMVVPDDPSNGTCVFPVETLSAEKADSTGADNSEERWTALFNSSPLFLPLFIMLLLALLLMLLLPSLLLELGQATR